MGSSNARLRRVDACAFEWDPEISVGERFVTFGVSTECRLLVVGPYGHGDIIRIITGVPR